MLIPITIPTSSDVHKLPPSLAKISHDEIVLVELQGAIEVETNHPTERNGKFVGTLSVDDASNKPTLRIGYHLLEGKVVTLAKPLAVLHRSREGGERQDGTRESQDDGMDWTSDSHDNSHSHTKWTVDAVVKKKIVFAKRPMPIVGRQLEPLMEGGKVKVKPL